MSDHDQTGTTGGDPTAPATNGAKHQWSSEAVAAEDQRRMQELMFQRRFPRLRPDRPRKDRSDSNGSSTRRSLPASFVGIGALFLTIAALVAGMLLRDAMSTSELKIDPSLLGQAPATASGPPVTVPVIVDKPPPGTPKVCKLPDERTNQTDELYKGTDVNRQLLPYSPFRLIEYPCNNLSTNIRMMLLYRDAIVQLQGGQIVGITEFDASDTVSFRAIAEAVNDPAWIAEVSGGVFQVDSAFVQLEATSMTIASPDVKELRFTSRPHTFLGGRGATLLVDGVKITSWDPDRGGPDLDPSDGRAFILYERGSQLDINNSEITYLGSDRSGAYGTSWRTGGTTGSAINSEFTHNWFGVYTFEAQGIVFRGNTFADNDLYGLDPHDYSYNLTVEQNVVYGNGSHGLIFSRGVVDSVMRDNHVYDNGGNGIVLDLGSDRNAIENNVVENNKKDGIVLIGSGSSTIENNTVRGNRTGIRLNDPGARNIDVTSNLVEGNRTGIHLYKGAGDVRFTSNVVRSTAGTAVIAEGPATMHGLEIVDARTGIDARSAVDLEDVFVDGVEVGLLARDRGVIEVRSSEVSASDIGIRLLPGTTASRSDDVVVDAPETLKATSAQVNWRHVLPYIGVGAIMAAVVLEIVRGSRTRGEWARLAPAGVKNIR
jgi:poly(beta-D-mannuronate) C5 epimerase